MHESVWKCFGGYSDTLQHNRVGGYKSKDVNGTVCPNSLNLCKKICWRRGLALARKRHSDEDVPNLLSEIWLTLTAGDDVAAGCR